MPRHMASGLKINWDEATRYAGSTLSLENSSPSRL
jgi:hypothetical protein